MAAIRTTTSMILKEMFSHKLPSSSSSLATSTSTCLSLPNLHGAALIFTRRQFSFSRILCAASDEKKVSARLSQINHLLQEAEERASSAGNEPPPKITLGISNISCLRGEDFFVKISFLLSMCLRLEGIKFNFGYLVYFSRLPIWFITYIFNFLFCCGGFTFQVKIHFGYWNGREEKENFWVCCRFWSKWLFNVLCEVEENAVQAFVVLKFK